MKFYKGDSIKIQLTINEDVTDWKIRASISDTEQNETKIATANSGGSASQISTTPGSSESTILLQFPSGETDEFKNIATLEVEVDTGDTLAGEEEIYTILQEKIELKEQRIDWTTP